VERIKDLLPGREGYVGVTAIGQSDVCRSSVISLSRAGILPYQMIWGFSSNSALFIDGQKTGVWGASVSALGR